MSEFVESAANNTLDTVDELGAAGARAGAEATSGAFGKFMEQMVNKAQAKQAAEVIVLLDEGTIGGLKDFKKQQLADLFNNLCEDGPGCKTEKFSAKGAGDHANSKFHQPKLQFATGEDGNIQVTFTSYEGNASESTTVTIDPGDQAVTGKFASRLKSADDFLSRKVQVFDVDGTKSTMTVSEWVGGTAELGTFTINPETSGFADSSEELSSIGQYKATVDSVGRATEMQDDDIAAANNNIENRTENPGQNTHDASIDNAEHLKGNLNGKDGLTTERPDIKDSDMKTGQVSAEEQTAGITDSRNGLAKDMTGDSQSGKVTQKYPSPEQISEKIQTCMDNHLNMAKNEKSISEILGKDDDFRGKDKGNPEFYNDYLTQRPDVAADETGRRHSAEFMSRSQLETLCKRMDTFEKLTAMADNAPPVFSEGKIQLGDKLELTEDNFEQTFGKKLTDREGNPIPNTKGGQKTVLQRLQELHPTTDNSPISEALKEPVNMKKLLTALRKTSTEKIFIDPTLFLDETGLGETTGFITESEAVSMLERYQKDIDNYTDTYNSWKRMKLANGDNRWVSGDMFMSDLGDNGENFDGGDWTQKRREWWRAHPEGARMGRISDFTGGTIVVDRSGSSIVEHTDGLRSAVEQYKEAADQAVLKIMSDPANGFFQSPEISLATVQSLIGKETDDVLQAELEALQSSFSESMQGKANLLPECMEKQWNGVREAMVRKIVIQQMQPIMDVISETVGVDLNSEVVAQAIVDDTNDLVNFDGTVGEGKDPKYQLNFRRSISVGNGETSSGIIRGGETVDFKNPGEFQDMPRGGDDAPRFMPDEVRANLGLSGNEAATMKYADHLRVGVLDRIMGGRTGIVLDDMERALMATDQMFTGMKPTEAFANFQDDAIAKGGKLTPNRVYEDDVERLNLLYGTTSDPPGPCFVDVRAQWKLPNDLGNDSRVISKTDDGGFRINKDEILSHLSQDNVAIPKIIRDFLTNPGKVDSDEVRTILQSFNPEERTFFLQNIMDIENTTAKANKFILDFNFGSDGIGGKPNNPFIRGIDPNNANDFQYAVETFFKDFEDRDAEMTGEFEKNQMAHTDKVPQKPGGLFSDFMTQNLDDGKYFANVDNIQRAMKSLESADGSPSQKLMREFVKNGGRDTIGIGTVPFIVKSLMERSLGEDLSERFNVEFKKWEQKFGGKIEKGRLTYGTQRSEFFTHFSSRIAYYAPDFITSRFSDQVEMAEAREVGDFAVMERYRGRSMLDGDENPKAMRDSFNNDFRTRMMALGKGGDSQFVVRNWMQGGNPYVENAEGVWTMGGKGSADPMPRMYIWKKIGNTWAIIDSYQDSVFQESTIFGNDDEIMKPCGGENARECEPRNRPDRINNGDNPTEGDGAQPSKTTDGGDQNGKTKPRRGEEGKPDDREPQNKKSYKRRIQKALWWMMRNGIIMFAGMDAIYNLVSGTQHTLNGCWISMNPANIKRNTNDPWDLLDKFMNPKPSTWQRQQCKFRNATCGKAASTLGTNVLATLTEDPTKPKVPSYIWCNQFGDAELGGTADLYYKMGNKPGQYKTPTRPGSTRPQLMPGRVKDGKCKNPGGSVGSGTVKQLQCTVEPVDGDKTSLTKYGMYCRNAKNEASNLESNPNECSDLDWAGLLEASARQAKKDGTDPNKVFNTMVLPLTSDFDNFLQTQFKSKTVNCQGTGYGCSPKPEDIQHILAQNYMGFLSSLDYAVFPGDCRSLAITSGFKEECQTSGDYTQNQDGLSKCQCQMFDLVDSQGHVSTIYNKGNWENALDGMDAQYYLKNPGGTDFKTCGTTNNDTHFECPFGYTCDNRDGGTKSCWDDYGRLLPMMTTGAVKFLKTLADSRGKPTLKPEWFVTNRVCPQDTENWLEKQVDNVKSMADFQDKCSVTCTDDNGKGPCAQRLVDGQYQTLCKSSNLMGLGDRMATCTNLSGLGAFLATGRQGADDLEQVAMQIVRVLIMMAVVVVILLLVLKLAEVLLEKIL